MEDEQTLTQLEFEPIKTLGRYEVKADINYGLSRRLEIIADYPSIKVILERIAICRSDIINLPKAIGLPSSNHGVFDCQVHDTYVCIQSISMKQCSGKIGNVVYNSRGITRINVVNWDSAKINATVKYLDNIFK